jgi:hypothetical protein
MTKIDTQSVSALIRKQVNIHGELHLDAQRTALLINWLMLIEHNNIQLHAKFKNLVDAINPIVNIPKALHDDIEKMIKETKETLRNGMPIDNGGQDE